MFECERARFMDCDFYGHRFHSRTGAASFSCIVRGLGCCRALGLEFLFHLSVHETGGTVYSYFVLFLLLIFNNFSKACWRGMTGYHDLHS